MPLLMLPCRRRSDAAAAIVCHYADDAITLMRQRCFITTPLIRPRLPETRLLFLRLITTDTSVISPSLRHFIDITVSPPRHASCQSRYFDTYAMLKVFADTCHAIGHAADMIRHFAIHTSRFSAIRCLHIQITITDMRCVIRVSC